MTKKNTIKKKLSKKSGMITGSKLEKNNYNKISSDFDNCEKKYCKKELQKQKTLEKAKNKIKCNYDEKLNYKFDKYNQVKIKYDYNPLHFPYNKIKTSPCIIEEKKLLNEPYLLVNNCVNKYCKKEKKAFIGV
jgi:hypothetical protein